MDEDSPQVAAKIGRPRRSSAETARTTWRPQNAEIKAKESKVIRVIH